jgi:hypothetical protein
MADELATRIAKLQSEFQHFADVHPWICLSTPRDPKGGIPTIGELFYPPPCPSPASLPKSKILDGSGKPFEPSTKQIREANQEWEAAWDQAGGRGKVLPPWVRMPEDPQRVKVVNHVQTLTFKASGLLIEAMKVPNKLPADERAEIVRLERLPRHSWRGWMCWLDFATIIGPHGWRENYCQDAASALGTLREYVDPEASLPSEPTSAAEQASARHSADFRSVYWYGTQYEFTTSQAACVKILWEHWEQRTPAIGEVTLLERAGLSGNRLRDVFEKGGHPAWGTMIIPGDTKGSFQLSGQKKKS